MCCYFGLWHCLFVDVLCGLFAMMGSFVSQPWLNWRLFLFVFLLEMTFFFFLFWNWLDLEIQIVFAIVSVILFFFFLILGWKSNFVHVSWTRLPLSLFLPHTQLKSTMIHQWTGIGY